jgi:hypothetical protein
VHVARDGGPQRTPEPSGRPPGPRACLALASWDCAALPSVARSRLHGASRTFLARTAPRQGHRRDRANFAVLTRPSRGAVSLSPGRCCVGFATASFL